MNHLNPDAFRVSRALVLLTCLGVAACGDGDQDYHDKVFGPVTRPEDAGSEPAPADAGAKPDAMQEPCVPAVASDKLPAREVAMADDVSGQAATDQGVFTKVLFDEFVQHCGSCHAGTVAQGGLTANLGTFPQKIGPEALARIRSDAAGVGGFMPPAPGGVPFSQRGPSDPIRSFAERLEQWIAQGRPADVFFPKGTGSVSTATGYLLSKSVGSQMTNLGNCIPAPYLMSEEQSKMAELDAKFAAMKSFEDLPKNLQETDVVTFDAEKLASYGVVAFAPAYTLWADNAKKVRMVRVPNGETIQFDADSQSFTIPPNTRFYKTFMKETTDLNGRVRYRKMETRIIVARPAQMKADGTYEQTALFGSYRWNEAETEATLLTRAYRDGKGFRDEVFPYVVDERLDDEVLRKGPKNQLAARIEAGAMRTYAIPGYDRCMHCHMGAPMQNFVLGFIPLQIHRRPIGEGGVIEEAARDELNQLQRLIDYGVVSGLSSADDVKPLEESQGARKPRNEHELNAQGYMLGNCAHCHNPNGFPSLKEPVLKDALNFLPGDIGGIFQFPLDKFSPRTFRGDRQDVRMPYITPSLYDLDYTSLGFNSFDGLKEARKWIEDDAFLREDGTEQSDLWAQWWNGVGYKDNAANHPGKPLLAPWRSLIYRNVDTPFSYEEVGTIFPHMPMDTPGYDCRARRLLGSWMVSIPSTWKRDSFIVYPDSTKPEVFRSLKPGTLDEFFADPELQPYEEVMPDSPGFFTAEIQANNRLNMFRSSPRFNDCPPDKQDVLDPLVAATGIGLPAPKAVKGLDLGEGHKGNYSLTIPARPHYFETDLRQDTSWIVRRGDWYEVMVPAADDNGDPYDNDPYLGATELVDWKRVYDSLQQTRLTPELKATALSEVPFGLWQDKPECKAKLNAADVPTVGDYTGDARPEWMKIAKDLKADAPVYTIAPGAEVFDLICSKCHGPQADGQSSLASTMADLTGGLTRVANLRDGIFGPPGNPGANRNDATIGFNKPNLGSLNGVPLTPDDWAARYTVWMGLGGTRANLPRAAVASIGVTDVLGVRSGIKLDLGPISTQKAANMLEVARLSCRAIMPNKPDPAANEAHQEIVFDPVTGQLSTDPARDGRDGPKGTRNYNVGDVPETAVIRAQRYYSVGVTGLITSNGHAELWKRLCTLDNPMPVRLVSFESTSPNPQATEDFFWVSGLYRRSDFPAGAPVGNGQGKVVPGLQADNMSPWCVIRPTPIPTQKGSNPMLVDRFQAYVQRTGLQLPMCPDEVTPLDAPGRLQYVDNLGSPVDSDDVERWTARGAMNAGMSVFVYLDALSKGQVKPKPKYNHCEELEN